eukprot:7691593-Lingulodinium_polyedra.AAC.1
MTPWASDDRFTVLGPMAFASTPPHPPSQQVATSRKRLRFGGRGGDCRGRSGVPFLRAVPALRFCVPFLRAVPAC